MNLLIKQLIQKVLTNNQFREELVINSELQSKKFSWSKTAKAAIFACEKIVEVDEKENLNFSYQSIIKLNKKYLEDLFLKISKIKFLNKNSNDQIWQITASSIDRINKQIDFFSRGIITTKNIESWRIEGPFDSSYSLAKLNRHLAESLNKKIFNLFIFISYLVNFFIYFIINLY